MNKLTKNTIKWVAVIIIIIGMKCSGNWEYQDVVIGSISIELYNKIKSDIGDLATDKEICAKYQKEKSKYDALGI